MPIESQGGVLLSDVPKQTVVVEAKSWWSSKTLWFNVLTTGLEIADWAAGTGIIPLPFGPIIVGIGNIILRKLTTQPVGEDTSVPVAPAALQGMRQQYFAQMQPKADPRERSIPR